MRTEATGEGVERVRANDQLHEGIPVCGSGIPANACTNRNFSHYPLKIGDHVFVGNNTIVEAALVGNHVTIGSDTVIGKFTIIKDYVKILDGTVVPPNTVIPSFSVVAGRPGRVVDEVKEGQIESFDLREAYRSVGNEIRPPS